MNANDYYYMKQLLIDQEKKITLLSEENNELALKLLQTYNQNEATAKQNAICKKDIKNLSIQILSLTQKLLALDCEYQQYKITSAKRQRIIAHKFYECVKENQKLIIQNKTLKQQENHHLHIAQQEKNNRIKQLTTEIEHLRRHEETMRGDDQCQQFFSKQLNVKEILINKLKSQNDQMKILNKSLQFQLNELRLRNSKLKQQLQTQKLASDNQLIQNNQLRNQLFQKTKSQIQFEIHIENQWKVKLNETKQQNKILQEIINDQQKKLKQRERENSSKQTFINEILTKKEQAEAWIAENNQLRADNELLIEKINDLQDQMAGLRAVLEVQQQLGEKHINSHSISNALEAFETSLSKFHQNLMQTGLKEKQAFNILQERKKNSHDKLEKIFKDLYEKKYKELPKKKVQNIRERYPRKPVVKEK